MFSLFPQLPAELQFKIWEASLPRPGIQIFDVCFQPRQTPPQAASSETADDAYTDRVFLDNLTIRPEYSHAITGTKFTSDPSTYKMANTFSVTSVDSAKYVPTRISSNELNTVYLPRKRKAVCYDNMTDVLCLRFGLSHHAFQGATNNVLRILEAEWCDGMATALYSARRVAIDISELSCQPGLDPMSVAYLCCCIQNDLEVLYVVDYCVGRCKQCFKGKLTQRELVTSKCSLAEKLDSEDRNMDVIWGSTVTYREVSDLERLGWDPNHPTFALIRLMGDTIREQQGGQGPFRSVRVLVCQEAGSPGDGIVCTTCT